MSERNEKEAVNIGLRSERGPILAALMLCNALTALDATVIATAVLSIVDDLGGFAQFPWLFSIYLLAQAVTAPVYGKLADLFGRKRLLLFGIAAFALGSVLCGLAWSMPALIAFRAVQGIGAGAIQPMVQTIAGDIYTVRERAKAQGYLASVWAMSSLAGPAIGGLFSEFVSWRWIFYVNVPLCAVAALVIQRSFKETRPDPTGARIDWVGALLLTGGAGLLILGVLEGGEGWAWASGTSVAVFAGGVVLVTVFAVVESRVAVPILPLWVLTRRVLVATSLVGAVIGAVVVGLTTYIPTFVQGVLGHGALVAGFTLAPLLLAWPLASSQSGRLYLRIGFQRTALIGSAFVLLGTAGTLLLNESSSIPQVALTCVVIGSGMGLIASPALIAAQSSVEWNERGVVTSTNAFIRSIGSAVGIALFGALLNANSTGDRSPADLADGLHPVFWAFVVGSVLLCAGAAAMPRKMGV